jgi:hypothetical protein
LVSVGRLSSQPAAGSGGLGVFGGIGSGLFLSKFYSSIEYIFKAWTPCGKKAIFLPCSGNFFKVAYIGYLDKKPFCVVCAWN